MKKPSKANSLQINKWIKRHKILSKNYKKKFYYIYKNKKYTIRKYTDLIRYQGGKYLECDEEDLNSCTNKKIIEFENEDILNLHPLGEIINRKNEKGTGVDYYIIKWSDDDIEEKGLVGELKIKNK